MYKIKQMIAAVFTSTLLCSNIAIAEEVKFDGVVTLPSSITDLLDSCSGEDCPSISIDISEKFGNNYGYFSSVDYNDTSAQYEYHVGWMQSESAGTDENNNYSVTIHIYNGNMGEWETLYYDFGSDHQIGTTGGEDSSDSILHSDEVEFICPPDGGYCEPNVQHLNLPLTQTDTLLDIDLSNKDEGRQKVTGKFLLPDGTSLGNQFDGDGNITGHNYMSVDIVDNLSSILLFVSAGLNPDENGYYTWTTSIKYDPAIGSKLSLQVHGELDTHRLYASYDIGINGEGNGDHTINGNEKLVTAYLDASTNYAEFTGPVADFELIDVVAYLDGAKILAGSFIPPETFPLLDENDEFSSIYLGFYSRSENLWFNTGVYIDKYNGDLDENGSYSYALLLPQDVQGLIQENNLSHTIDFNYNNFATGIYKHWHNDYSFGDDNQVGGTGDNEDHILGVCEDMWSAMPLVVDFSMNLPVVDVNLSDHILQNTSKVSATLEVPSQIENVFLMATDMTCGVENNIRLGNWTYSDGMYTYVEIQGLVEGHEYAIDVSYNAVNNFDNWYGYVLNDNDGNFTNGGVYLDEVTWDDEIGQKVYPVDLALITGGEDVVISPFEFILPPSSSTVSPAVIMYLLN